MMGSSLVHDPEPLTAAGVRASAELIGCEVPAMLAVIAVESAGCGFLPDRRQKLLFERHVFHRQTRGIFDVEHPGVSSIHPGGYVGGAAEYGRFLEALQLDAVAAYESASWGLGQVMGFNYRPAGYGSAVEMRNAFNSGEDAQLRGMAQFIDSSGLGGALRDRDWRSFAKVYNGPGYAKNQYDQKLKAAYERALVKPVDLDVRALQMRLMFAGRYKGAIDGIMGPQTVAAIEAAGGLAA